jgi:hypothetical protein
MNITKRLRVLHKTSREENDVENQLSPLPSGACNSGPPRQSVEHIVTDPLQAQLPEFSQTVVSPETQLGGGKFEDGQS